MRKLVVLLALAALLMLPARRADAVIGTLDATPAATLLLPYFQVDLNDPNGVTTLFSINNASATAVLAHVTFWTDLSVPSFTFNVYLTGYDVQTINVRDIFNGTAPRTASDGQDPTDTISRQGAFSQDINFASCNGLLPPPPIDAVFTSHLAAAHLGNPDTFYGGVRCSGLPHPDGIARGYITVDTVNICTLRLPNDVGYFINGGFGDATLQNVLWGDYFYVNSNQNFAQGDVLTHIEASATDPATSIPGRYTFYGKSVAFTAADNREPLATTFVARFLNGGPFSGGSNLVVWRDSKTNQSHFVCGTRPGWFPLGQEQIAIFDEQEQVVTPPVVAFGPVPPSTGIIPFSAETQLVKVNGPDFPVAFTFGWLYLNLNTTVATSPGNPPVDPAAAQAFVAMTHDAEGRYSVGYQAIALDSATAASHDIVH